MKNETLTVTEIRNRFQIVDDREVLHPSRFDQGPRIGRVQTVLDTRTGVKTEVNFWYDDNGKLLYVR